MSKRAVVSLLLIASMLLYGCGSDNDEPASQTGAVSDITSDTESAESSEEVSEAVSEEIQKVTNAQKWIDQIKDNSVILTYEQIQAHNKKIASASPSIVDVTVFPSVLDGKTLKTYLNELSAPSLPKYNGSTKITQAQLDGYIANKNLDAVKDENNEVRRAVVSQRAALKSLPTDARFFRKVNEGNFDQIMETGLYAGMPVLVLHTSADGKWYFVQSYFYRGWVSTEQIYITANDE